MGNGANATVSDVSKNFGIVIAFLLPGFIALWSVRVYSPTLDTWFQGAGLSSRAATGTGPGTGPTAGSFLFVVVGSLALGMLISAARWALLDKLLNLGGRKPALDHSKLMANLAAVEYINANHYNFYLYYANSAVAILVWGVVQVLHERLGTAHLIVGGAAVLIIEFLLVFAAKDAIDKTAQRLRQILGESQSAGGTNDKRHLQS